MTTYQDIWKPLVALYGETEAKAVARLLLDDGFGLSLADVLCGRIEQLPAASEALLRQMLSRLLRGEPVQYVLGKADFGPRSFLVAPGVLIPRPETYELCQWVVADATSFTSRTAPLTVLDIGTGSGCIACTLAAELAGSEVTAWELSPEALQVARANGRRIGVGVSFQQRDMLAVRYGSDAGRWDIVVSNPPYVCESEAEQMEPWVLGHEPHMALFVADDDPLLFYRHISNYAQSALKEGGRLYFEINPLFDEGIEDILLGLGFDDIVCREDQYGKQRFIKATWH